MSPVWYGENEVMAISAARRRMGCFQHGGFWKFDIGLLIVSQCNFSCIWYRWRVISRFYYGGNDIIAITAARGRLGVVKMADSESSTPLYWWSPNVFFRVSSTVFLLLAILFQMGKVQLGCQAVTPPILFSFRPDPQKAILHFRTFLSSC
jgi:hypothetical protein